MFTLIKKDGRARRGRFETPHGTIETPVFMNVATCGAIKGGLGAEDLREVNCQVMLSNTYHLHVRPGDTLIHDLGGLRKLTGWSGPVLTDSGGFQVFSLSQKGRGRLFLVACGRAPYLYGSRREHAHTVESRIHYRNGV